MNLAPMFFQKAQVAFQPKSAIGVFWPYGGPQAAGPTVWKSGGVDAYGGDYVVADFAYVHKSGLFFQPVTTDKNITIGISVAGSQPSDGDPDAIHWAFRLKSDGTAVVVQLGTEIGSPFAYAASDTFLIGYDGNSGQVSYSVNGSVVHTTTGVSGGLSTWLLGSFKDIGGRLRNLQFGPLPEMRFPAQCGVVGDLTKQTYTDLPGLYIDEPYDYPGDWDDRMTESVYAMLRDAGFDAFRLQINPGPWLEAMLIADATDRAARLEFLNQKIDQAVYGSIARGFGIILVPFYTGFAGLASETALQGLETDGWANHLALLEMWAYRYAATSPALFMPETFNEPPSPDRFPADWNNDLQPAAYTLLRSILPDHTILLTADSWSGMERMVGLDLGDYAYDVNTIWDIHPFRPSPFAQQGYIYTQYKHVGPINDPVRYPPDPAQRPKIEADYVDRATLAGVSEGERTAVLADLGYYFDIPQGGNWLRSQMFADVLDWCAEQGIPPARILVGEWGIVRDNGGFPLVVPPIPGSQGASRADRAAYLADFRSAITLAGFRSSVIHLDTLDYGITLAEDHFIGALDPLLLAAIAPKANLLRWSVN